MNEEMKHLTEEEISRCLEIAKDAYETGGLFEHDVSFGKIPNPILSLEEYLEQLKKTL